MAGILLVQLILALTICRGFGYTVPMEETPPYSNVTQLAGGAPVSAVAVGKGYSYYFVRVPAGHELSVKVENIINGSLSLYLRRDDLPTNQYDAKSTNAPLQVYQTLSELANCAQDSTEVYIGIWNPYDTSVLYTVTAEFVSKVLLSGSVASAVTGPRTYAYYTISVPYGYKVLASVDNSTANFDLYMRLADAPDRRWDLEQKAEPLHLGLLNCHMPPELVVCIGVYNANYWTAAEFTLRVELTNWTDYGCGDIEARSTARVMALLSDKAYSDVHTDWPVFAAPHMGECSTFEVVATVVPPCDCKYCMFCKDRRFPMAKVYRSATLRWVVVAFEGTDPTHVRDVLLDLNFPRTQANISGRDWGLAHQGFLEAWNAQARAVLDALQSVDGPHHLFVTGHSLGGGVATLAALELATQQRPAWAASVSVFTFGSPRVGDHVLATNYRALANNPDGLRMSLRYVNTQSHVNPLSDPITNLPWGAWGFEHVHDPVLVNGGTNDPTYVAHLMTSYIHGVQEDLPMDQRDDACSAALAPLLLQLRNGARGASGSWLVALSAVCLVAVTAAVVTAIYLSAQGKLGARRPRTAAQELDGLERRTPLLADTDTDPFATT
eukprot:Colp12_sorted_trinity150504_noHs@13892